MVASVTATRQPPEGDVASQPAVPLLEAKLHPPARVSALVPRPRLVGPLLDREGPPVVALIAGPGYGKTTLLSQWVDQERRAVAWLTLDELDNDPAMLVAYLEAAFGRIHRLADDGRDHAVRRRRATPSTRRCRACSTSCTAGAGRPCWCSTTPTAS